MNPQNEFTTQDNDNDLLQNFMYFAGFYLKLKSETDAKYSNDLENIKNVDFNKNELIDAFIY